MPRLHRLRFALIADTHFGSKLAATEELAKFIRYAYGEGVRMVFHAGDLLAGHNVYRGQIHDLDYVGFDDQADEAIRCLPQLEGLTYRFITGNHDLSFRMATGLSPGAAIQARAHASSAGRTDIIWIGDNEGSCKFPGKIRIWLVHPGGSPGEANSYRLQKLIRKRAWRPSSKPTIICCGHDHSYAEVYEAGVYAIKPGGFEWPTEYSRRKVLQTQVGGVIVEVSATEKGMIRRVRTTFVPF